MEDNQQHNQPPAPSRPRGNTGPQFNANPFGNAPSNAAGASEEAETQNWMRNVTSADAADAEASSSSTSDGALKGRTQSRSESDNALATAKTKRPSDDDENLTIMDTVKSAAHAARQKLHLQSIRATGPSRFFNPTNVRVHVKWRDESDNDGESQSRSTSPDPDADHEQDEKRAQSARARGRTVSESAYLWRSRDNRKGRGSIAIPSSGLPVSHSTPLSTRAARELRSFVIIVFKMATTFPYWDMAFWSGWSYTWGSVLFIMDSAWSFEDVGWPGSVGKSLTTYGAPLCFFFGALLYELGALMAYLEAVNDGSFQGSAMRKFLENNEEEQKRMLDHKIHSFFGHIVHHRSRKAAEQEAEEAARAVDPEAGWRTKHRHERPGSIYPLGKAPVPRRGAVDYGETEEGTSSTYLVWRWWPSWQALRTHHVYEIGYLACAIQLFGATLYTICGLVGLPGILSTLADGQVEGAYWIPQIVASVCFLTAAVLFTLETQEKWWRPEPNVIGWWIGIWAGVGSMGFLLSAIFGAASYDIHWGSYQSDLSSTWGSTAYLFSGLLQWYEATNKRPIEELLNEPGKMKSFQVHPI